MRNRGFNKNVLAKWFSQVKYSNRAKFLDGNPDDTCYYQGTRETGSSQDADANFGQVKSANFYAKCEFITKVVSKNSRAETLF